MNSRGLSTAEFVVAVGWLVLAGCNSKQPGQAGRVLDEAAIAGRNADSFKAADADYFHDMDQNRDGVVRLTPDEIKGRNMWIVWTGGDDRLWDVLSRTSFGTFDLLKTVSSRKDGTLKFGRYNRWEYLGVVNEPCFEEAKEGRADRFGLWLDKRRGDCQADPFEDEQKYQGVKIGARGRRANFPIGSYYGYATGIVGLRLFPNPDFDEKAEKNWDAERYYKDEKYYNDKNLVKPYRVGMSCGFCHVGPNPIRPPADANSPKWENLSSNVGAQYFWFDRIFAWQADESSLIFQVLHTYQPGSLDTSLVSTDNIDNPRAMNAVYNLGARLGLAQRWGIETLAGGSIINKQLNDFVDEGPLAQYYMPPATVWTPRVLKDGADSVGVLGALNRVYINIGLFSEEWLLHFNALFGGKPTTPIEISVARKNSIYWNVTEAQTPAMAAFLLKTTEPHYLKDAPGGAAKLSGDEVQLRRGKVVFAERCARCHSSKAPELAPGVDPGGCSGPSYLSCWDRYWRWTKTEDYKSKMREIVLAPGFLDGNYLSSDLRVPVTLLETNACSPLATNAIGGNVWDNFSSQTYKDLPSVGTITYYHPVTGEPKQYQMPADGRGYTRPASLISLWSTAPFLLNNSVGNFEYSPSVESRMKSFDNSIRQMLWPEERPKDIPGSKVPGLMDRTTAKSWIKIPSGYLPELFRGLLKVGEKLFPWAVDSDGIAIGPIPKGVPVGLLANIDLLGPDDQSWGQRLQRTDKVLKLLIKAKKDLKRVENSSDDELKRVFENLVDPLLELSKCPDFIVNRGHYFGTDLFKEKDEPGLSPADKDALIAFLKTF